MQQILRFLMIWHESPAEYVILDSPVVNMSLTFVIITAIENYIKSLVLHSGPKAGNSVMHTLLHFSVLKSYIYYLSFLHCFII